MRWIVGVAYDLEFPVSLGFVHLIFHTSMWKKYIGDHSLVILVEYINVTDSLSYEKDPEAILDCQVWKLRSKEISSVKVLWRNQRVEGASWESEDYMRDRHPNLFDLVNEEMEGTI